ncbi:YncE family protein, partial [Leadbetterella sp. DM7]
ELESKRQLATINTGNYPHGLRLSPDGRSLYVANVKSDSVSVIDVASLRETGRIAVGKAPVQVGFSADGKQAYVSLSAENALGLIDTAS